MRFPVGEVGADAPIGGAIFEKIAAARAIVTERGFDSDARPSED
jgi:hypothetical protein